MEMTTKTGNDNEVIGHDWKFKNELPNTNVPLTKILQVIIFENLNRSLSEADDKSLEKEAFESFKLKINCPINFSIWILNKPSQYFDF